MKATIIRKEHFNSAHRLHNENWTPKKNKEVFGKCNNPNFHGHNYLLEVHVTGEIDLETGYVIDTKILSQILKEHVTNVFDHKNLNLDVDYFKKLNPTAENIAMVIFNIVKERLDDNYELKIKLYETERNAVEFHG
ncbi:MAG: 6-pyruvoyl trahydropterin synthase family protein [Crocinitomicaceae bacterium]